MKLTFAAAILTTPVVPRFNPDSVQAPEGISAPRASGISAEAFGSGLGAGIQKASSEELAVAKQEQDKADLLAVDNTKIKSTELMTQLLYDPNTGALNKKGSAAFGTKDEPGIVKPTLDTYDVKMMEYIDSLPNDKVKEVATKFYEQDRNTVERDLLRHVTTEKNADYDQTFKAVLDTTGQNIARFYQDPDRVAQETRFGEGRILAAAQVKGYSADTVKDMVSKWRSEAASTVIETMLNNGQATQAKGYFDTAKDTILPDQATKILHKIQPLAEKQEGQEFVSSIYSDDKPLNEMDALIRDQFKGKTGSLEAARHELHTRRELFEKSMEQTAKQTSSAIYAGISKKIMNGEPVSLADVPPDQLNALYNANAGHVAEQIVKDVKEYGQKAAVKKAEDDILNDVTAIELRGKIAKTSDIAKVKWDALRAVSPEKAAQLIDHLRQEGEHAADRWREQSDKPSTAQVRAYVQLLSRPELLKSTNLDSLFVQGGITRSQVVALANEQRTLNAKKEETPLRSNADAIKGILESNKVVEKKDPETFNRMFSDLYDFATAFKAANGKEPTQGDYAAEAKRLIETKISSGHWYSVDKPFFKTKPEDLPVPKEARDQIVAGYRAKGIANPTDDQIRTIYRKSIIRGGK